MQQAREVARRARSVNNLKQAGLALHQFEGVNGRFPPGAVYGPFPPASVETTAAHGLWPFLLPYLEHQIVFNQYNWSIDFNGQANHTAMAAQLGVLHCPSSGSDRVVSADHAQGAFTDGGAAAYIDYSPVAGVNALFGLLGMVDPGNTHGVVLAPNVMCRVAESACDHNTPVYGNWGWLRDYEERGCRLEDHRRAPFEIHSTLISLLE
jgi:hypothetical protein